MCACACVLRGGLGEFGVLNLTLSLPPFVFDGKYLRTKLSIFIGNMCIFKKAIALVNSGTKKGNEFTFRGNLLHQHTRKM